MQQKVDFVDRAMKTILGLDQSGFCIIGYTSSSPVDVTCPGCRLKYETIGYQLFDCQLQYCDNYRVIPIQSVNSFFGYFLLFGDSIEASIPFEHLFENFLTILSISIDNLVKKQDLERLNKTLEKSEKKYHELFASMEEGFALHEIICDETGTPTDYRFLEINPAFERMTGLKAESIIGKRVLEVLPETEKHWIENYGQVALTGNSMTLENYSQELNRYYRVIAYSHQYGQFASVIEDITERKQAEEERKVKNEELLRLNAEKDKFFSIIAHDLRSPFSSFLGFTKIMAEELPTLTLDQIQHIAINMRKSATSLYNLLDNLLEWSRLQRGVTQFRPESFDLMTAVIECIEALREHSDKKDISIFCNIPHDCQVFGDVHMIQTIIRNLVSNAVKYTGKGGQVEISADTTDEGILEFAVKDKGIGLNPEMTGRLFRLDQNINRPGTEGEPSTGLGLIICKEFVELHGGKIRVESTEGKGCNFFVAIPGMQQY